MQRSKAADSVAGDPPRFDVETLRSVAGAETLARGQQYFRVGKVQILAIEPLRVLAQVEGSEDYRTEVFGTGKRIHGVCSCPAFAEQDFCKHMVATALAANAAGSGPKAQGVGTLSRIREHLRGKEVEALVDMIVDLAERDPDLRRKLDMAASVVQADDKALEKRLRKAIDDASLTDYFIGHREVSDWANAIHAIFDTLTELVAAGRARLALSMVERAIDRLEQSYEDVDDEAGQYSALLERARDIHLEAAGAARPEPVQFARELFVRETESDHGEFNGAASLYADVLGDQGLAEYRRLATAAWEKLPPYTREMQERREFHGNYHGPQAILDFFAERDGDIEARIALRMKNLSTPQSYLQLAEFCSEQGREAEALGWAEEGLRVFGDRADQRLIAFAIGLLAKAGRSEEAEAHLLRAFERAPSIDLYERLCKLGGEAARQRALNILETRLATEKPSQWHHPADLLVRILTHDKTFDAAWETVRKHGASLDVREALARKSEATHPQEALRTYTERVDDLANAGGNPAYAGAAKLVAQMATLRSPAEQAAHLAALKVRYRLKRNLMKLLS